MKTSKYLFIIVFFIYHFQIQMTQAQDIESLINNAKIGIKGMINLADMSVTPTHRIDTKILGGFGAYVQINVMDKFYFQPELLISLQGGVQHTFAPNVTDYEYITDEKLTYMLLPLMGQYHLNQFYVEAGIQPAVLLTASYHYQAIDNGEVVINNHKNITDSFNSLDMSLNIGAGYQINKQLSAGIRYSKGLIPINKYRQKATLKNSVISFSVSYVIFN